MDGSCRDSGGIDYRLARLGPIPILSHRRNSVDLTAETTSALDGSGEMARVTGLEPATLGVTGRYSNQLSYTRALDVGVQLGRKPQAVKRS